MPTEDQKTSQSAADVADADAKSIWAEIAASERTEATAATQPAQAGNEGDEQDEPTGRDAPHQDHSPSRQPADEAGQRPAPDIWANASPELRAAYEQSVAERKRLGQDQAHLRQVLGSRNRELEELRQRLAAPQGAASGQDAGNDDPEIQSLMDEYPEIAAPLVKRLKVMEERMARTSETLQSVAQERTSATLAQIEQDVRSRFADYDQVLGQNGAAFKAWLDVQPRHIREAAERNGRTIVDAAETIDVLDRFYAHIGRGSGAEPGNQPDPSQSLADRRQRRLETAHNVRSRGPSVAAGIPAEGDPKAIWDSLRAAERNARR